MVITVVNIVAIVFVVAVVAFTRIQIHNAYSFLYAFILAVV